MKLFAIFIVFFVVSNMNITQSDYCKDFDNTILFVGGSGPGNYSHIQDAINDAEDNYLIVIYNGTYYEDILVDKSISLIGHDGANITKIIGSGIRDTVIISGLGKVLLNNLTIQSKLEQRETSGIQINADNVEITNCIISNNFNGITCSMFHINIKNCVISSNEFNGIIFENGASYFNISDCEIMNNANDGIFLNYVGSYPNSENIIYNCSIYSNGKSMNFAGITVMYSENCQIKKCSIDDNYLGLSLWNSSNFIIDNCIISNSLTSQGGAIFMGAKSINHLITNCCIEENTGFGIKIVRGDGELIGTSNNNIIYNNIFKNNSAGNAWDECYNKWYLDNFTGGNEWDDYQDRYPDATLLDDGTGTKKFWSEPYVVPGKQFLSNSDNYPIANVTITYPPVVKLNYPLLNERFSKEINISWNVKDRDTNLENISINISYSNDTTSWKVWKTIKSLKPIGQNCHYIWNISNISNGVYKIKINANDTDNNLRTVYSPLFIIGNELPYITGIRYYNLNNLDTEWVRDGDTLLLIADIIGVSNEEYWIYADLSCFGDTQWSNVAPDSFDGITAKWTFENIDTNNFTGTKNILVTVVEKDSNRYGRNFQEVKVDNQIPKINIINPKTGLYIIDREIIPFNFLFHSIGLHVIFGPVTISAVVYDSDSGINNVRCYNITDARLVNNECGIYSWYWYGFSPIKNEIKIEVTDQVGNIGFDTIKVLKFF